MSALISPFIRDLTGQRFGKLEVLELAPRHLWWREPTRAHWTCSCDCGSTTVIPGSSLTRGFTRSCGCLGADLSSRRLKARLTTHGHSLRGQHTRTYNSWCAMRRRCYYPKHRSYPHYGGREIPITVCERWSSFENFLEDMGVRPAGKSIDRIDVNGNYEPGNCRWATDEEQRANQRPPRPKEDR